MTDFKITPDNSDIVPPRVLYAMEPNRMLGAFYELPMPENFIKYNAGLPATWGRWTPGVPQESTIIIGMPVDIELRRMFFGLSLRKYRKETIEVSSETILWDIGRAVKVYREETGKDPTKCNLNEAAVMRLKALTRDDVGTIVYNNVIAPLQVLEFPETIISKLNHGNGKMMGLEFYYAPEQIEEVRVRS